MKEVEKDLLHDLVGVLRDSALEFKKKAESSDFERGRRMGYYEIISTIQQMAKAFGLSDEELGLKGFDPDRDIL